MNGIYLLVLFDSTNIFPLFNTISQKNFYIFLSRVSAPNPNRKGEEGEWLGTFHAKLVRRNKHLNRLTHSVPY